LAIVKQRKVHGNEYYEVSWRNIDGLQVSVVPGDLVRRYICDAFVVRNFLFSVEIRPV
jgi:hypothetical protein